ncbi:MAG: GNAT family N-acetyltransferase [Alphaproteobacteria bacterium]
MKLAAVRKAFVNRGKVAVTVRRARVSDVPQIVALAKIRDGAKKKWSAGRRSGFTLQLRHIVRGNDNHRCWVAVDEAKRIVGYGFASFTYSPIDDGMWLHVTELYVRPRLRSSGVGQRLMRTIKTASRKVKARGVSLITHPNNMEGKRFYRRHDFAMMGMVSCCWVG